jgi:hypothetical protein
MDGFVSDLSNSHFRAWQICHNGDAPANGPGGKSEFLYSFPVAIEIAMGEVEPSYVHPCPNHLFHNFRGR